MNLVALLDLPAQDDLNAEGAQIPSSLFPSDHLRIGAVFDVPVPVKPFMYPSDLIPAEAKSKLEEKPQRKRSRSLSIERRPSMGKQELISA